MKTTGINDRLVRIIGIPFFGFLIPNATGLVDNGVLTGWQLVATYAWFVFSAGSIWQGNRYFLFRYIEQGDWLTSPFKRLLYLLGINTLYTLGVAFLQLWLWTLLFPPNEPQGRIIFFTVVIIFVCVIFITSAYELIYRVKQGEAQRAKAEQLETAKILAELEALKSHVDPHFMFNSLNLVSYLIDYNPAQAKLFLENLSDVYRYILQAKNKNLVLLQDEMEFAGKYMKLLEMRFENALQVAFDVQPGDAKYLIPPVSVMMALENAVKHNQATSACKLHIQVSQRQGSLVISNTLAEKKNIRHSSKTGLHNLDERFKHMVGQPIVIEKENHLFTLTLPLLPLTAS